MHPLMAARQIKKVLIACDHHMTQRHRRCAALQQCAMCKEEPGHPAMQFQNAIHPACVAGKERVGQKHQPKQTRG